MSQKITKIVTSSISYEEIKKGDIVEFMDDNKQYVVIPHGQTYHLIPIDMKNKKEVYFYSVKKPEIKNIYDGKNGHCKIHRDDLVIKLEEEIDDEIL